MPIGARSRQGRFVVKRRTDRKRLTRKLNSLRVEMRHRMPASEGAECGAPHRPAAGTTIIAGGRNARPVGH